jgi:hypothetical protein
MPAKFYRQHGPKSRETGFWEISSEEASILRAMLAGKKGAVGRHRPTN